MTLRLARLYLPVLVLLSALTLAPLRADVAQGGSNRSVLVTVLDEKGLPLDHLTAADFVIREDNLDREVIDARPAPDPLVVSLIVDSSAPPMGISAPTRDLRVGLSTFVKTIQSVSPEALIALTECGGASVTTVNFTAKTADLEKGINRIFPSQRSSAVLLEALVDAGRAVSKRLSPRRAIVSVNFNSWESSSLQPPEVADAVERSGAAFWAVSIQKTDDAATAQAGVSGVSNAINSARDVVLSAVTSRTGGMRLVSTDNSAIEALLRRVALDLGGQYVVTYYRPAGPVPKIVQAGSPRGVKTLMTPWVK